ncbi:MAG: DUF3618 domain-containing protein [Sulfitobacter sp.]|nr:DUF3618 domain-containing protein [Sulfitobacter sp.]
MPDTRSPEEIERDIERERAELTGTLDTLQDRFSFDGMARQVSTHLQENGSDIARNVSATVKENPLGVALVGAGLAWLAFGSGPSVKAKVRDTDTGYRTPPPQPHGAHHELDRPAPADREYIDGASGREGYAPNYGVPPRAAPAFHSVRDDDPEMDWFYDDLDDDDRGISDGLRDRAAGAADHVRAGAHSAAEGTRSAGEGVAAGAKSAAQGTADAAKNAGSATAQGVKDTASSVGAAASSAASSVRDGAASAAESARLTAARTRERLAQGTERLSEEARERVIRARAAALKARDRASTYGQAAIDRSTDAYDSQPLAFGALAFAIGAAAAAAIPGTRREDELVGDQSDRLKRRAQRIFEEERRRAEEVGGAVANEANRVVKEARDEINERAPGDKTAGEAAIDKADDSVKRVADKAKTEADKKKLGKSYQD